jgi:outer membrane protein TolC
MLLRVHTWFWLFAFCAVTAGGDVRVLAADQPQAVPVTLDGLVEELLDRNPAIQAKRHAYEAARARVIAAWLPDDPEFGVDAEGQPDLLDISNRSNVEYMAVQSVPFPTTLFLRGRVALRDAQIAHQQYQQALRQEIWHIEQPYYDLYLTKKTLSALYDLRALLDKLAGTVRARYETNRGSQEDLLKANIELSKIEIELFQTQQREQVAEAHVSHLLDRPLDTTYALAQEQVRPVMPASRQAVEQRAIERRPELRAAELGIQRAKAARWLAATNWLPDVTGRIEARRFRGDSGVREYDSFIGLRVPVWSLIKGAGGEWKGANRDVRQAQALYAEMKNEALLEVAEAYAKAASAEQALTTYEQFILPQAKQQVEVALAAYEAGRVDFLNLIDAQRMLKEAQLAFYRASADYEQGLSDLRRAVGGPLEEKETQK